MKACTTLLAFALTASAGADITLTVRPNPAPNVYGSPSWGPWVNNALFAIENGLTQVGDRETDPTAYLAITDGILRPGDIMVTSFPSWRGKADPGTFWGPQFANEHGNRMHFGLHIMGDGIEQFRMEDLTFEISSTDGNALGWAGNFVGLSFNDYRHGIDWGPDRIRGTSDDIRYISGPGTVPIDEFVYVGVGNAYWPQPDPGQSEQDAIQEVIDWMYANNVAVTGAYEITSLSGNTYAAQTTLTIPTPAPAALLMLAGLTARRRR